VVILNTLQEDFDQIQESFSQNPQKSIVYYKRLFGQLFITAFTSMPTKCRLCRLYNQMRNLIISSLPKPMKFTFRHGYSVLVITAEYGDQKMLTPFKKSRDSADVSV
jgi:hypothetical protein